MPKRKRKENSIYDKYREILGSPKLSDEEIDKMRIHVRLMALAITEHVTESKVNQIY
jgi:hypothetical protein